MIEHYRLLSTTVVPNEDGESFRQIHLYQVDEDENRFLWDLQHYETDRQRYLEYMEAMNYDPTYIQDVIDCETVKSRVMSAINLVEEPDWCVPPGGRYHRYEVKILFGVVVVDEEIALNI